MIEKMMKQLLRRVRRFSRKALIDKEMFSCVRDCVDDLFDDLWPELENEIMYAMRLQFDIIDEYKRPEVKSACCLSYCLNKVKAAYLYAQYPCKVLFIMIIGFIDDASIWSTLRNPVFWLIFVF
jgi:hypothetical protein